jgi:hypothetical protein
MSTRRWPLFLLKNKKPSRLMLGLAVATHLRVQKYKVLLQECNVFLLYQNIVGGFKMSKRIATSADLVETATYLRDRGHRGIYVIPSEPGTIRWTYEEPKGIPTYCAVGMSGRIWLFVNDDGSPL